MSLHTRIVWELTVQSFHYLCDNMAHTHNSCLADGKEAPCFQGQSPSDDIEQDSIYLSCCLSLVYFLCEGIEPMNQETANIYEKTAWLILTLGKDLQLDSAHWSACRAISAFKRFIALAVFLSVAKVSNNEVGSGLRELNVFFLTEDKVRGCIILFIHSFMCRDFFPL